jgi:hypothetical protein
MLLADTVAIAMLPRPCLIAAALVVLSTVGLVAWLIIPAVFTLLAAPVTVPFGVLALLVVVLAAVAFLRT